MLFELAAAFILFFVFFFNDTATTEIYTLSLHDALPISRQKVSVWADGDSCMAATFLGCHRGLPRYSEYSAFMTIVNESGHDRTGSWPGHQAKGQHHDHEGRAVQSAVLSVFY